MTDIAPTDLIVTTWQKAEQLACGHVLILGFDEAVIIPELSAA